jgi:hypothetical protein
MEIEPVPGGVFREVVDEQGHGVVHASVTAAIPGRLLRMVGPLGLAGNAVLLVSTVELLPHGEDGTRLVLTCEAAGHVEPAWGAAVQGVWKHFLFEQFEPWYREQRGG